MPAAMPIKAAPSCATGSKAVDKEMIAENIDTPPDTTPVLIKMWGVECMLHLFQFFSSFREGDAVDSNVSNELDLPAV